MVAHEILPPSPARPSPATSLSCDYHRFASDDSTDQVAVTCSAAAQLALAVRYRLERKLTLERTLQAILARAKGV